jgi:hypothetical protein
MGSSFLCPAAPTLDRIANATMATRASLMSKIIAAHARNQACMLMLPNGARGKDRSHSA